MGSLVVSIENCASVMRTSGMAFLLAADSVLNVIENTKRSGQSEESTSKVSELVEKSSSTLGSGSVASSTVVGTGRRRKMIQSTSSPLSSSASASHSK